jgi:hypothetical protein
VPESTAGEDVVAGEDVTQSGESDGEGGLGKPDGELVPGILAPEEHGPSGADLAGERGPSGADPAGGGPVGEESGGRRPERSTGEVGRTSERAGTVAEVGSHAGSWERST